ncbi:metallophosphoesterase family protein [Agrobacterium sp. NPDC090273]|uniref:metallophosphoesterase family protein n=1 Tax=Agrobacterium sp. NPDC090273 TaxID=3363919 RepID=UPI00383A8CEA
MRRRIDLGDVAAPFPLYAIGDVHGRLDLLLDAERKIMLDLERNNAQGVIVMLGDYIDRGPDSAGVVQHLLERPPENIRRVCICGNHEDAFLDFMRNPRSNLWWLDFGGRQTLLSYGVDADYFLGGRGRPEEEFRRAMFAAVPQEHVQFMSNLPVSLRSGKHLFVHAGVRPGIPLEGQTDQDLMWIREPFLVEGSRLPLTVIHGHTPVEAPQVGPGRIGIDTGAVTTGRLTVLKVKGERPTLLV